MLYKIKNHNSGFTLIEVILSIAILSIVSVVVLRLFVVSHDLNESSRTTDHASNISINVIETIKGYRNLNNYLADNQWIEANESGYQGTIIYDELSTIDTLQGTILTCILTQDQSYDTLYNISVSVYSPIDDETIVTYKASHYFALEVSE